MDTTQTKRTSEYRQRRQIVSMQVRSPARTELYACAKKLGITKLDAFDLCIKILSDQQGKKED